MKIEKNTEKPIQKYRFYVQLFFVFLTIWIGYEFHGFVKWLESGGAAEFVERPPGVEAFLPISSLMSLMLFFKTGEIHSVHPAGLFIFVAIIAVSLIFGKSFCSWICPIGFISEMIGDFGEKIQIKLFKRKLILPKFLDYPLRSLKYLLLFFFASAVVTMSAAGLKGFLDGDYNILSDIKMYYFFADITLFSFYVLLGLFVLSIIIRNFWCRYLCPYGALVGILTLISPLKIKRNPATCTDCGLCAKACPSHIKVDKVKTVISDECTTCMQCVDACPVADTLDLKPAFSQKKVNKRLVGILILIIYFAITGIGFFTGNWQNDVSKKEYLETYKNINSIDHLNQ